MTKRPHILITNDDGIDAPGIRHLWQSLVEHFDLTIVAPLHEKSGAGLGITMRDPLHIQQVVWDKGTRAWKISGTPADCIRLGMSVLLEHKPDLIVSGINRGSNAGRNVLYSGTVGGTIEGVLRNVPGIAFSCEDYYSPKFERTEKFIAPIVQYVFDHPLPHGTLLNVNFPSTDKIRGVKLASQGLGYWIEDPDKRVHPEGSLYYWLGGKWHHHDEHPESDISLLKEGYVAAVPIHVHQLTDKEMFSKSQKHFDDKMVHFLTQ
jgi:5'-nucleotidase